MWLFDDLLKKPSDTSTSSGGTGQSSTGQGSSGGTQDPLAQTAAPVIKIEKTNEVSISTESAAMTAPSAPAPVTAIATDDVSSILITSSEVASPIITQDEASLIISHDPEAQTISNVEVSPITPEITPLPQSPEVTDLWNLFWTTEETSREVSISTDEALVETATESESIVSSSTVDTEVSAQDEVINTDNESIIALETPSETYEHPSEFIAASIARIDAMIERIDTIHNTKLEEALGYKAEKEKYTTLEEQAYADAEKYVTEKEHALSMRNYFVDQWRAAGTMSEEKVREPVATVETTLTGLAVQNAVTETVKSEKKTKAKKEEETTWILGL